MPEVLLVADVEISAIHTSLVRLVSRRRCIPSFVIARCEEKSVSVAIEEIRLEDWAEQVYKLDIHDRSENLYKKSEYNPFEWHGNRYPHVSSP